MTLGEKFAFKHTILVSRTKPIYVRRLGLPDYLQINFDFIQLNQIKENLERTVLKQYKIPKLETKEQIF